MYRSISSIFHCEKLNTEEKNSLPPWMFHNKGEADDYVYKLLLSSFSAQTFLFSALVFLCDSAHKLSDSHNPFNISTLADYRTEIPCYF